MAQPHKHPDTGIYYLRRKVPSELRSALGREFKRSLKTREPAEAKARFAAAWSESEHAFALARAQRGGAEVLSQQDAQQLAARWFQGERARMEKSGSFTELLAAGTVWGIESADSYEEHQTYVTLGEAADEDPDIDWPGLVQPCVERTLRQHNLPLPPKESMAAIRLFAAFEEHLHMLSAWALKRQKGNREARDTHVLPYEPIGAERKTVEVKTEARRLLELFELYAQDKTLNHGDTRGPRRTIAAYRATVARFVELHGDMDVRMINREVVGTFRSSLAQLPAKGIGIRGLSAPALIHKAAVENLPRLSQPTIRNRLREVSAVLSYGVLLGWMQENPIIAGGAGKAAAKAASRRQIGARRRKDYTAEELRTIFESPVFAEADWSPPRADFGKAWYWVPLLLYYTGARREEIAQLAVSDIKHSQAGGWHLSILATIDEEDGPRGVKTDGSRRLIPLHSDLVKRRFLDYVESLSGGPLFPMLKPDPKGYFGTNFGKRWAVYLRQTVGLKSPASPSHGFRHTFKTLCRQVGIPEDVHDAVTGHAGGGTVARDYGSMPLQRMTEELLKFPTLTSAPGERKSSCYPIATDPAGLSRPYLSTASHNKKM